MKAKSLFRSCDRTRALTANIMSILIIIMEFIGITMSLVEPKSATTVETGAKAYFMFTIESNLLLLLSTILCIPFQIEGYRYGSFHIPRWVMNIVYTSVVMTSITFVVTACIMSPLVGFYRIMIAGNSVLLHLIVPLLAIIMFVFVQHDHTIRLRAMLIACTPFIAYIIVYLINVVAIGEKNGGWHDFYQVTNYLPTALALLLGMLLSVAVAFLLRALHNASHRRYKARMKERYPESLTDYTSIDEAIFALASGAKHSEGGKGDFVIPKRRIGYLEEAYRSGKPIEELCAIYCERFLSIEKELSGK